VCTDAADPTCLTDPAYNTCLTMLRRELITATAAISALASFMMGALANLPVGLAPGLGLNAFFAYSIVGFHGLGKISYQDALGAVFLEGWIFIILALLGVRQWLARAIPRSLILSIGAGIGTRPLRSVFVVHPRPGLFIAFIGTWQPGCEVRTHILQVSRTLVSCERDLLPGARPEADQRYWRRVTKLRRLGRLQGRVPKCRRPQCLREPRAAKPADVAGHLCWRHIHRHDDVGFSP
jgi:hypothetical protein